MPVIKTFMIDKDRNHVDDISKAVAIIKINNDGYKDCSPEEIERRKQVFAEACYQLHLSAERNKAKMRAEGIDV